jgi:hypothetical protein
MRSIGHRAGGLVLTRMNGRFTHSYPTLDPFLPERPPEDLLYRA